MRVKLENGRVIKPPYTTYRNGRQVDGYNRNEAMLIEDGWKLPVDVKPAYDEATQYLAFDGYTEDSEHVYSNYRIEAIPEPEPTTEEVLSDVVQKLTEKGIL